MPPTTVPEKSAATYDHEMLYVTIPKVSVSCNDNLDIQEKSNGESDVEGETEEERMQREVLEDLESFGSPRRVRSASRSTSPSASKTVARKSFESEIDQEKLQREVLEDLECFGSPRRRSASCTQSVSFNGHERPGSHQDFFRSVGSWVGGFTVHVQ